MLIPQFSHVSTPLNSKVFINGRAMLRHHWAMLRRSQHLAISFTTWQPSATFVQATMNSPLTAMLSHMSPPRSTAFCWKNKSWKKKIPDFFNPDFFNPDPMISLQLPGNSAPQLEPRPSRLQSRAAVASRDEFSGQLEPWPLGEAGGLRRVKVGAPNATQESRHRSQGGFKMGENGWKWLKMVENC